MKNSLKVLIAGLGLLTLSAFNSEFLAAHAQGTAFTYQGRLNNGTNYLNIASPSGSLFFRLSQH